MLKIEKKVPIRETLDTLAKFPRFSLIEKISPRFYSTSTIASKDVAKEIKTIIQAKAKQNKNCVLGLATGSTPIEVYKELIRMHKEDGLSFKNVITFNLDEYYPISHKDPQSYHYFMDQNLFDHIDIPRENINVPSGQIHKGEVTKFCEQYEAKIQKCGGIDLQILGIGRTGHIGFNQPPSPIKSSTRLVYLHRLTRKDAAPSFGGFEKVPKSAITMGIDTISKAKKVIIMAWSETKAPIVAASIEGPKTNDNPSTFLHDHPDATFYLDIDAGEKLSRFTVPWTIKGDYEDPNVPTSQYWILRSVIWLSYKVQKPILRLTPDDYEDYGLSPLVVECARGKVEDLNLYVFKCINQKITGWPLGDRPPFENSSDSFFPTKSSDPKKVLIFSPHPDDDVISMGATMARLVSQGHSVHVAYMTAGSNGVHDHQARKYLYFLRDLNNLHFWKHQHQLSSEVFDGLNVHIKEAQEHLEKKTENDRRDSEELIRIKEFIRESQARIAVESLGIPSQNVHALKLPFYGYNNSKNLITEKDYEIVKDLLRELQPDYVYAAGDLTDPHGTHRRCLNILLHIVDQDQENKPNNPNYKPLMPPPENMYFYRGAWEEWDLSIVRKLVVISPKEVQEKHSAILKHQSQKDNPLYPGDDNREFWLRTKERNRMTAKILNGLGFSDYQAIECFVDLNDLRDFGQI